MCKVYYVAKSSNSKTGNISQVYLDKSTVVAWSLVAMVRDISSLSSVVRAKDIVRIGVAGDISHSILILLL